MDIDKAEYKPGDEVLVRMKVAKHVRRGTGERLFLTVVESDAPMDTHEVLCPWLSDIVRPCDCAKRGEGEGESDE